MSEEPVDAFVYRELSLLDHGRLREWVELFAEDGVYWIPCNTDSPDPRTQVAILYEGRQGLMRRVTRMERGRAVQEVASRTCHVVSNLRVDEEPDPSGATTVESVMVIHETNRRRKQCFPGHCTYRLRPHEGSWKIVLKKLALIDNDQYYEDLSFIF